MHKVNDVVTRISNKISGRSDSNIFTVNGFLEFVHNTQDNVPLQILAGVAAGFTLGYSLTRISKVLAAASGVSMIFIQLLNYRGYINFNRNMFQRDFNNLASRVPSESMPTAVQVEGFLTKYLNFMGGFVSGCLIGYSFV